MSASSADTAAPLDEVMLAMDVVDTLRHRQDLVNRELDETTRETQLIAKLRDIYHQQGIEVPDHILKEGVAALAESRFVYAPPQASWKTTLARLYVSRGQWGRPVAAVALGLLIVLGGYAFVYQPWRASQAEQARVELAEGLPAQMDALTTRSTRKPRCSRLRSRPRKSPSAARPQAAEGNRAAATKAVDNLTALRDQLRQEYALRVVNRSDVKSGFWTFPQVNTEATNYYLVVEALDADNTALTLPILNEENGQTENVAVWGIRVPEAVYNSVLADKQDDGIIQRNIIGRKAFGFLDVDYAVPVLGGAVTRW